MNYKLMEFKNYIKGKKVAVLGMGISNTPLITYLSGLGADITGFDRAEEAELKETINKFSGLDIKYSLGKDYLKNLKGFDIIFKTPVVRFDIPELVEARNDGARVTSEMEIFLELCPARTFGVTGSDGKTTTTTLIYKILVEHGYNCWLGGNIGTPLLSRIDEIKASDMVVLELSSFQLHTMNISPDISVITNITPNHLDVHKSMEEYIDAKTNIFNFQKPHGRVILNYDNDITRGLVQRAQDRVVLFSRKKQLEYGACVIDGNIVYRNRNNGVESDIINIDEIVIPGVHNVENYLAATAAVMDYVSPEAIRKVARTFTGVEHRIELVRELNGIKFYNSSIDSSPNRTAATLGTFRQKVVLIAGGKDKNIPYDSLGPVIVEKVKCLILIGMTAPKIKQALMDEVARSGKGRDITIIECTTYEEAVDKAYSNAVEGDVVILSPASTSFDMFKNFEERGNTYKKIVNSL